MTKLHLPSVALVIYDHAAPRLARRALEKSLSLVSFGHVQVYSPDPLGSKSELPGVEWHPTIRDSDKDEGQRTLWYDLPYNIPRTISHVLNIEWDSQVFNPAMWTPEFLQFDYVGAPWPWYPNPKEQVGNGGFSLMSTRLLLELAMDPTKLPYRFGWDDQLCRTLRPTLEDSGFKWAPTELAMRFSLEYGAVRPAFGFHDCRNYPRLLSAEELAEIKTLADPWARQHPSWLQMEQGFNI